MKFRLVTDGYHICILKRFFIWETEVLRVEYSEEFPHESTTGALAK